METQVWIRGCGDLWHAAKEHELRGIRTGTVQARYLVTLCSGRQLGGVWGYSKHPNTPSLGSQCKRCVRILYPDLDADGHQAWGESLNRAR